MGGATGLSSDERGTGDGTFSPPASVSSSWSISCNFFRQPQLNLEDGSEESSSLLRGASEVEGTTSVVSGGPVR